MTQCSRHTPVVVVVAVVGVVVVVVVFGDVVILVDTLSNKIHFYQCIPCNSLLTKIIRVHLSTIFTGKLSFKDHVDFVITVSSQCVYLLKLL